MSAPTPAAPNSALACPLCGMDLSGRRKVGQTDRLGYYSRSEHAADDCAKIAEQAAEIARLRAELDALNKHYDGLYREIYDHD